MASPYVDFSDIRIILCAQGYPLDYQYIVREIGFWFNGHSGSIPFNCKINRNQLDIRNQKIIFESEEKVNGIRLKNSSNTGLALSETRAVLRTLYHLNESSTAKYIGITEDDNITGILFKAGLGSYVKNLNQLKIFEKNFKIPSNDVIRSQIELESNEFKVCKLHDMYLTNNVKPFCAKIKAEFLAQYCMNFNQSQEVIPIEHILEESQIIISH